LNKGLRIKIEKEKDHPTFSRVYIKYCPSLSAPKQSQSLQRERERLWIRFLHIQVWDLGHPKFQLKTLRTS